MRFVGGLFYEERELEATTDWLLQVGAGVPGRRRVHGRLLPVPRPACAAKVPVGGPGHEQPEPPVSGHRFLQRLHARVHAVGGLRVGGLRHPREPDPDPRHAVLRHREFVRRREHGQLLLQGVWHGRNGSACHGTCSNGTNVTEQADNTNQTDGFRSRANLTWRVTSDVLLYATWSEGYRPAASTAARPAARRIRRPASTSGASRRPTNRTT